MQVMPRTAQGHADVVAGELTHDRLFDPAVSIMLGADVLRRNWEAYPADIPRIAASYNAGRGSTRRWDRHHYRDEIAWIEAIPCLASTRLAGSRQLDWPVLGDEKLNLMRP